MNNGSPMAKAVEIAAGGVYGGRSATERRTDRRARLLEAAVEVLGTDGWAGTSVREICKRAGLNARYFYESFGGLEDLLVAVFDCIADESAQAAAAAMAAAPADVAAQVRAAVSGLIGAITADPRKARIAYSEALGSEALMRRRLKHSHYLAVMLREARLTVDPDADRCHAVIQAEALSTGLAGAVVAWLGGYIDVDRDQFIDYCAQVVESALLGG